MDYSVQLALLAAIVASSNDAIVSKTLDGRIQSWNAGATRIFGYQADEVIGKPITIIVPPELHEEERRILDHVMRGEHIDHFDTIRLTKDGRRIPISLTVSPVRDSYGTIIGASKFARDISERKAAEQALRESEQRLRASEEALRESDRRKDEFLALLAHELRGPLATLQIGLELMKRAGSDEDLLRQARGSMERQLGQLVRLIDDLLDVSRITRNKIDLRRELVELAALIHQSIEDCRPFAESARHEVSVALPSEPMYVEADPARLAQVFGNILHNACKYTEPGGHIGVTAELHDDEVAVKIKDTGVGIPSNKLSSIFEMFLQVDRTLERSQGGLGIGLSLVKRLVEMHGGSVKALSDGPGRGSEFVVRLPVAAKRRSLKTAEPASEPVPPSRRILIVDDNTDSAASLALLLQASGHAAFTAHDGLEALNAAERLQPDAILLDLGLPKLNGYEVCRRLREQPWGKHVVIVALTGWGQIEDRQRSMDAGFDAHMVKPPDYTALMQLLMPVSSAEPGAA